MSRLHLWYHDELSLAHEEIETLEAENAYYREILTGLLFWAGERAELLDFAKRLTDAKFGVNVSHPREES